MAQTVVGQSMVIEGEISGDDSVVVQGTVKGKITVKEMVQIDNAAHVEADIQATTLSVSGQLKGNVLAREKIEVTAAGRVVGNMTTPRILIADGAAFKGSVEMDL